MDGLNKCLPEKRFPNIVKKGGNYPSFFKKTIKSIEKQLLPN